MARFALILAALGVVATVVARVRRRARVAPPPPPAETADPRADELRRKLEESRALVDEREEFEAGETPVDRIDAEPVDPAERRQQVHEEGRAAIERMQGSGEGT